MPNNSIFEPRDSSIKYNYCTGTTFSVCVQSRYKNFVPRLHFHLHPTSVVSFTTNLKRNLRANIFEIDYVLTNAVMKSTLDYD